MNGLKTRADEYIENKILVFAGTYEGRKLCEMLSTRFLNITACVATDYGKVLLEGIKHTTILSKRLDAIEMEEFIKANEFEMVIDATHPYAKEVTANIKLACAKVLVNYERLLRDESHHKNVISVENVAAAANFLKTTTGNVLVATGSKELGAYCDIPMYKERLFVRVLPSSKVLSECEALGFSGKHIVAMQGPFSHELNVAVLTQLDCAYLVTKSTGLAGGVDEKISAALQVGTKVIVIDRPVENLGHSFNELLTLIAQRFCVDFSSIIGNKNEFFPLYIPTTGKNAMVVGGGKIATRRIKTLLKFNFHVAVIAPETTEEIAALAKAEEITLANREFLSTDLVGCDIAIAATNDRNVNKQVGKLAKAAEILVSVADAKEECNFYFPAVVTNGDLIVGITSGGTSHVDVKLAAKKIRGILN